MKNPTDRDRELIIAMLGQFRAAQETLLRGEFGSSGGVRQMPKTWTPEMRELERCLGLLCRSRPKHHRHVMAKYVDPLVARKVMVGRVQKHAFKDRMVWPQLGPNAMVLTSAKLPEHKGTSTYTCLVASWPAWVNKPIVDAGIDCLLRWYEPPSAVGLALPLEMVAA